MRKILLLSIALSIGLLQARTLTGTAPTARKYDQKWLDINRWKVPFYNDGRYGLNVSLNAAGGDWPQPLKNHYIFGAGIWVGCLQDTVDGLGLPRTDTLVTFSYNPNSGGTEMVPGNKDDWQGAAGSAEDRVYRFPDDWPPPRDWFAKNPKDTVFVPFKNFSLQDMWCVFCDFDPDAHTSNDTRPIGFETYLTVYAWNYTSNRDIFFLKYVLRNTSGRPQRDMYLGAVMDADIGLPSDDMVGLIKDKTFISGSDTFLVKNVGFAYDNDNTETNRAYWQEGTPGCVAFKFLDGPIKDSTGGQPVPVMTAFKRFNIEFDPPRDPARYLTMAGYDYRNHVYNPYDSIDLTPADKRFIQTSGPFTLLPDSSVTFLVAVIAAEFGAAGETGAKKDTLELAKMAATAQYIYDQNWLLPGPPFSPNLTLIPGDKKVTLIWNNLSELLPDPYYQIASNPSSPGYDPAYRQYDFEGYKIYKSEDGIDWSLLDQCDLSNGVVFADTTRIIKIVGTDTIVVAETIGTNATDKGLFYTYVDNNVANGFKYYYTITSYDYNFQTISDTPKSVIDTFSLEGGKVLADVTPRSEPSNWDFVDTVNIRVTQLAGDSISPGVSLAITPVIPVEVPDDTWELKFLGPGFDNGRPAYRFYVKSLTGGSLIIDTTKAVYPFDQKTIFGYPNVRGVDFTLTLDIGTPPANFFDSVLVKSGGYPVQPLNSNPNEVTGQGQWAFRGSDYEITWQTGAAGFTVKVFDKTNNIEVPYTSKFLNSGATAQYADGWCFLGNLSGQYLNTSTLKVDTISALYVCGGLVFLNGAINKPITAELVGKIRSGDSWMAYSNRTGNTAPSYSLYNIVTKAGRMLTKFESTRPKVRAVPNPYLISNQWETSLDKRVLAFTHLPDECTIRIYNLAGDLVKTLKHSETTGKVTNPALPMVNDLGGTENWNLLNDNNQLIATGVYVFHVQSKIGEQVGKFVIVR